MALIVGRFGLREWLAPDGMIRTLMRDHARMQPKTASFARLRRFWDTTQKFWRQAIGLPESDPVLPSDAGGPRLVIQGRLTAELGPHHAYDMLIGGVGLPVLYLGDGKFLTAANLQYVAKLLGEREPVWTDPLQAAEAVKARLNESVESVEIWEESGYGGPPAKKQAGLAVTSVQEHATRFRPAIVVLSRPETFMALVPANRAFRLAKAIKDAYEEQMGRVQDRLPLTLGMIVAQRRTPLAALLDAGRRMLEMPASAEDWTVMTVQDQDGSKCKRVVIRRNGSQLTVNVPIAFEGRDGPIEDRWYPNWLRNGNPAWVGDLSNGQAIQFRPSRFDYEILDTAGRRFDVGYDREGRRYRPGRSHRPYYLQDIDSIFRLWDELTGSTDGAWKLSSAQIHQVVGLIEQRRVEWGVGAGATAADDPVFRSFVRQVLLNAGWRKFPTRSELEDLENAGVSGVLADVVEIFIALCGSHEPEPAVAGASGPGEGRRESHGP
jgi:hypothetical protein